MAIAQLRSRAAKARRASSLPDALELIEQSLTLCDEVVRELAGNGLKFDDYRVKLDAQAELWTHLFQEMPVPCVETDASGIIVGANRAAAQLLNTSVKHLSARLLMHFAEDRDKFGHLLGGLSAVAAGPKCLLTLRPRERAPVPVEVTVIARSPGDVSSWLWFMTPAESLRPPRHDRPINLSAIKAAGLLS
jgi:hypothetical protein